MDDLDTLLDAGNVELIEELLNKFFNMEEGESISKQSIMASTTITIVFFVLNLGYQ